MGLAHRLFLWLKKHVIASAARQSRSQCMTDLHTTILPRRYAPRNNITKGLLNCKTKLPHQNLWVSTNFYWLTTQGFIT
jgi:hypothetical protein